MAHIFAGPNAFGRFELEADGHTAFANYRNGTLGDWLQPHRVVQGQQND